MIINVWLALRDDAHAAILTRLAWDTETQGEYTGPVTDRQARVFGFIADRARQLAVFKKDVFNSREWTLWTVDFNLPVNVLRKVQDELYQLALDYPNQFKIGGAWHWDSRQVGTQFILDPDTGEVTGISGTPLYPLDMRLLKFMPNIKTWDADGNLLTDDPATFITDVNLVQGQTPRRF